MTQETDIDTIRQAMIDAETHLMYLRENESDVDKYQAYASLINNIKQGYAAIERIAKRYEMKELAFKLLEFIEKRETEYEDLNDAICAVQPNFPSLVQFMDYTLYQPLYDLIDAVLGDTTASYYMQECRNMKDGGAIHEDGKIYPIRNLND